MRTRFFRSAASAYYLRVDVSDNSFGVRRPVAAFGPRWLDAASLINVLARRAATGRRQTKHSRSAHSKERLHIAS